MDRASPRLTPKGGAIHIPVVPTQPFCHFTTGEIWGVHFNIKALGAMATELGVFNITLLWCVYNIYYTPSKHPSKVFLLG